MKRKMRLNKQWALISLVTGLLSTRIDGDITICVLLTLLAIYLFFAKEPMIA
jgi:hypothetical protein